MPSPYTHSHTHAFYLQFVTELSKYRHTRARKFTAERQTVNEKDHENLEIK